MAADIYGVLNSTELPYGWDYAVTSDGRVFFINDYDKITTWISPVTGEPIQSGHSTNLGLPRGWEVGYTPDAIKYFINHNERLTTFTNPMTGKQEAIKNTRPAGYEAPSMSSATPLPAEHSSLDPSHTYKPEELTSAGKPITTSPSQSGGEQRNVTDYPSATAAPDNSQRQQGRQAVGLVYGSKLNESDSLTDNPYSPQAAQYKASRLDSQANPKFLTNSPITSKSKSIIGKPTGKKNSIKRQPTKKKMSGPQIRTRPLDSPVSMKGWLYKFESNAAGVRKWKHRFFVLQNFCLYTYKDVTESEILDSILLPSYKISLDTKYNKEFGFKAEHENMKTHYFAAGHLDSLNCWVSALRLASAMQRDIYAEQEYNRTEGDGTDSPAVSSPYHDRGSRNKVPTSPLSQQTKGRPSSLGYRQPSSNTRQAEPAWQVSSPSRYDADWKVRDEHDAWNSSGYVERSYTPPLPTSYNPHYNNYDYQDQSLNIPQSPPPPTSHYRTNNYDYHENVEYTNSYHQSAAPQVSHQSDYVRANGSSLDYTHQPPFEPPAVRGHSVLMPPYNTAAAAASPPVHASVGSSVVHRNAHNYSESSNLQPAYDMHAENGYHDYREQSIPVRGEPRTPPSVVSPPWKRPNPHIPAYRPPHYENVSAAPADSHTAANSAGQSGLGSATPPPPRPQKLSFGNAATSSRLANAGANSEVNRQPQQHTLPQPNQVSTVFSPQKWRDQLQAKRNFQGHKEPLIFQFPVPYKQPEWLEGHSNYRHSAPRGMSRNISNNNSRPLSQDPSSPTKTGQQAMFKPPNKVINRKNLTSNDLIGKSQEELTLLLIELRREKSQLDNALNTASERLRNAKMEIDRLQSRRVSSQAIQSDVAELEEYIKSTQKQLDIQRPLIQLIDNMVKMLNDRSADRSTNSNSQTHGDKQRLLTEFSRRIEEDKHGARADPALLETKTQQLSSVEQDMGRQTDLINILRHRMRKLEDDLGNVNRLLGRSEHPVHRANQLLEDKHRAEFELSQVRKQLASESEKMEGLGAESAGLRKEITAIRSQMAASSERDRAAPSSNKMLQSDVHHTQRVMEGLNRQSRTLNQAMANVKLRGDANDSSQSSSYFETDIDTMTTRDLALKQHGGSRTMANTSAPHRSKPTTMRDMKRASASRHEHQREADKGQLLQAAPVYFHSSTNQVSRPSARGVSQTSPRPQKPRPVSAYEPREHRSQNFERSNSHSSSNPPHLANANSTNSAEGAARPLTPPWALKPKVVRPVPLRAKAQARRKENRARFMTISSSQPVQLEAFSAQNGATSSFNSPQGNLSRSFTELNKGYTHDVIDDQFFAPEKVHIPERYVPDSSDEEEILSPEEAQRRTEKAEQIRKMVASQSLQEFSRSEINAKDSRVVQKLNEEKKRRETVLEMRHAMAKEVTQKSKESRGVHQLRSKSQENLYRPIESY